MALNTMPEYEHFIHWYTDVMLWILWKNRIRVSDYEHIISYGQSHNYIVTVAEAKWKANEIASCKPKVFYCVVYPILIMNNTLYCCLNLKDIPFDPTNGIFLSCSPVKDDWLRCIEKMGRWFVFSRYSCIGSISN